MKTSKRVAYHEAGHAVMAWRKGIVHEVSVIPEGRKPGDTLGYVKSSVSHHDEDSIRRILAGPIAEAMAMKKSLASCFFVGGISDYEDAKQAIEKYSDWLKSLNIPQICKREIDFEEFIEDTKRWLNNLWPAVEAMAKALMKKPLLTEKEVKRIIKNALNT